MNKTKQTGGQEQKKALTAAERLQNLENALMAMQDVVRNMANNNQMMSRAIKLLGDKVDAMVEANVRGVGVNNKTLSDIMVENNVRDLKQRVENLKISGILVDAEAVGADSFIVARELNAKTGEVIEPRLQMPLIALTKEVQEKLMGKKAGESIALGEESDGISLEIEEVYKLVSQQAEQQAQAQQ